MNKGVVIVLLSVLISILLLSAASSQEEMENTDNSDFRNPQRPPSVFHHDTHNETAGVEECNECHHIYEGGKKIEDESSEDQRCVDCHELDSSDGQPSLRKAFHANCKGCHLKQEKGPVMCGECHVRG